MAEIKKLQVDGADIYPVTHESAVYDNEGKSIESKYLSSVAYTEGDDIKIEGSEGGSVDTSELEAKIEEVEETANWCKMAIGDGNQLLTNNKNTVVEAINEVFQRGNNVKEGLVEALIAQGVLASTSESFESLIAKIRSIEGSGSEDDDSNVGLPYIQGLNIDDLVFGIKDFSRGSYETSLTLDSDTYNAIEIKSNVYVSSTQVGSGYILVNTVKRIDFTNIDSIDITYKMYSQYPPANKYVIFGAYDDIANSRASWLLSSGNISTPMEATNFSTSTLDTTSITGNHYFGIAVAYSYNTNYNSDGLNYTMTADITNITFKGKNLIPELDSSSSIITATSLPATGEENQLCVITDGNPTSFYFNASSNTTPSDAVTFVCISGSEANYMTTSNGITNLYNISYSEYNGVVRPVYLYKNGQWISLALANTALLENGIINPTENNFYQVDSSYDQYWKYTQGTGLYTAGIGNNYYASVTTTQMLNFDEYNSIQVTGYTSVSSTYGLALFKSDRAINQLHPNENYTTITDFQRFNTTPTTFTYDITSWSGSGYLGLVKYNADSAKMYITDIKLMKASNPGEGSGGSGDTSELTSKIKRTTGTVTATDDSTTMEFEAGTKNPYFSIPIGNATSVVGLELYGTVYYSDYGGNVIINYSLDNGTLYTHYVPQEYLTDALFSGDRAIPYKIEGSKLLIPAVFPSIELNYTLFTMESNFISNINCDTSSERISTTTSSFTRTGSSAFGDYTYLTIPRDDFDKIDYMTISSSYSDLLVEYSHRNSYVLTTCTSSLDDYRGYHIGSRMNLNITDTKVQIPLLPTEECTTSYQVTITSFSKDGDDSSGDTTGGTVLFNSSTDNVGFSQALWTSTDSDANRLLNVGIDSYNKAYVGLNATNYSSGDIGAVRLYRTLQNFNMLEFQSFTYCKIKYTMSYNYSTTWDTYYAPTFGFTDGLYDDSMTLPVSKTEQEATLYFSKANQFDGYADLTMFFTMPLVGGENIRITITEITLYGNNSVMPLDLTEE